MLAVSTKQSMLPEPPVARWFQREASNAAITYFLEGNTGHPLIVCPTGGGKTHIMGDFCQQIYNAWPSEPILIISHNKEILRQDYETISKYLPKELFGVYSAGLKSRTRGHITIAGVQSIADRAVLFKKASLILVDEAHRIPPTKTGQYAKVFRAIPHAKVIGFTATPFRLGSGYLHEGEGALFNKIVYDVDIIKLIDQGYLCPLVAKDPLQAMDTDGLHTRQGDFITKEMSEKLDRDEINTRIVNETIQRSGSCKSWLIFAIDIKHCENIAIKLWEQGILVDIVHSKRTEKQNDAAIEASKKGKIQALVCIEKLTTGYDNPKIDLIVLARPTQSPVLHIQMIGRGLRVFPGKKKCLVLDFAGNVNRLGPINEVHVVDKRSKKKGEPIVKTCPECRTICYGSTRICPECGHQFVFAEKLNEKASTAEIIRKEKKKIITWFDVNKVSYSRHTSKRKLITLKVTYNCGLRFFHDWISLESESAGILHQARHWWNYRTKEKGVMLPPESVDEAVYRATTNGELYEPKRIRVDETEKYPRIKECEFND